MLTIQYIMSVQSLETLSLVFLKDFDSVPTSDSGQNTYNGN